jgi:hypothetical protein
VPICAIAAYCLALAGESDEARIYLGSAHMALPEYRIGNFLNAMQFGPDNTVSYLEAAKRIGAK